MKRLWLSVALIVVAARALAQPTAESFISVRDPVALVNARVIDGLGNPARADQTVLIERGKIAAIGRTGDVTIPTGAAVRDLKGKTVLPGFVLLHEHLYYSSITKGPFHVNAMEYSFPRLYLAAGVTSARTTGCVEPDTDLNVRDQITAGKTPGPKLHLTAPYFNGPAGGITQLRDVGSAADAIRKVNFWADEGFTSIKLYTTLSRDVAAAAIEAAHKRGMRVTGHLGRVSYREAAELGIDALEHGFMAAADFIPGRQPDTPVTGVQHYRALEALDPNAPEVDALFKVLIDRGVAVTSTLAIFETFTPGRRPAGAAELETLAPPLRESYLTRWAAINMQNNPTTRAAFAANLRLEQKFFRAGGLLAVGTDPTGYGGCIAGYGSWRAIELLVEAGLTPLEALQAATSHGARVLGIAAETGSLVVGKAADLVVVDGDPAQNISHIRNVETVFKDGIGYDSRRLFESVRGMVGIQ